MITPDVRVERHPVFGPTLFVGLPWRPAFVQRWREAGVSSIYAFHDARQWPPDPRTSDVSFVDRLTDVTRVGLAPLVAIDSLEPLMRVKSLEMIQIRAPWHSALEWGKLSSVTFASVVLCDDSLNVLLCPALREAQIETRTASFSDIHRNDRLRILELTGSLMSDLSDLARIAPHLERLTLVECTELEDVSGIAYLNDLRSLVIKKCPRVHNVEGLEQLSDLRDLSLDSVGAVRSLSPIRHLARLSRISLGGSTIIEDGDLSMMLELPELAFLDFRNRPHYSHQRHDLVKIMESKW